MHRIAAVFLVACKTHHGFQTEMFGLKLENSPLQADCFRVYFKDKK